jgi:hypothetical protein
MLIDRRGQHGVTHTLWLSMLSPRGKYAGSFPEILAYLDSTDVNDCPSSLDKSVRTRWWCEIDDHLDEEISLFRRWMRLLREEEDDVYEMGRTPRLHFTCQGRKYRLRNQSWEMEVFLLEFDAKVHATAKLSGINALQFAMLGWTLGWHHLKFWPGSPGYKFEQKLSLLIKAGADVNHCDKAGKTPSDTARDQCDCWDEWRRALESNGLDVDEVMNADEERRRVFWKRRDRRPGT